MPVTTALSDEMVRRAAGAAVRAVARCEGDRDHLPLVNLASSEGTHVAASMLR